MAWKKLSPAQDWLVQRLASGPLEVDAKTIGIGWLMPQGLKMSTVDALVKMGAIRRNITGQGARRKMTLTKAD